MDLKAAAREKLSFEAIRGNRRARLVAVFGIVVVALAVVVTLVVTLAGGPDTQRAAKGGQRPRVSRAVLSLAPRDGAKGVDTTGALKVSVARGTLSRVVVEDADGGRVDGELSADGRSWQPSTHLANGTSYTVRAVAEDAHGLRRQEQARFTTLHPDRTFIGRYTPEDGSTVGVGMPVSLTFDHPVTDRDAVEKAVTVTADPKVDVEGHWFGDSRLDFRPEEYWQAGTRVHVALDLDGVEGAEGRYGTQHKSVDFRIGRRQVSRVDAGTKKMKVERDGKTIRTIPISSGGPGHTTYNGRMVISERLRVTRMDGRTVGFGRDEANGGYDIKDVPHAMRLSTSGTFIHGNYWLPQYQFGHVNASHGCVGLFDKRGGGDPDTPGAWFFSHSMVGDVVEISHSHDRTVQPDNGLNGWNMSWEKWTADQ